ncbi:hypothetical protein T265_06985 [Opisthorchis viverrini]|uniref:Uncharacterized protein n=1 Tax=Opisthorchis viverrini TaxID=6198 RepID=A0A074ZIG0_OPIVI|nr:hypothetical protein T265_06985 [Opisthorchis viverrini]KER25582.1 hypothetical protein T265_06985 [Opisthorchis viverrini]
MHFENLDVSQGEVSPPLYQTGMLEKRMDDYGTARVRNPNKLVTFRPCVGALQTSGCRLEGIFVVKVVDDGLRKLCRPEEEEETAVVAVSTGADIGGLSEPPSDS